MAETNEVKIVYLNKLIKINKRLLITGIIMFVLLLISFNQVYKTAGVINNEISYKNYLSQLNKNNLNLSLSQNMDERIKQTITEVKTLPTEKIKFPFYVQLVLALTFFVLLKISGDLVDLYMLRKEFKL